MMDGLFLLLGSNIQDQQAYLEEARGQLSTEFGPLVGKSSIYSTEPWGRKDQNWFLNQVVVYKIPVLDASDVLRVIKNIEVKAGRKKRERWGPREIDIDILYWGDQVFQINDLIIPHPAIPDRKFTLIPLVELAAEKHHPVTGKTQRQLLNECSDVSQVSLFKS